MNSEVCILVLEGGGGRGGGEEGRSVDTDRKIHTCTATKDTEELCREYHTELNY